MAIEIKKIIKINRDSVKKVAGISNDPYTKSLLHLNGSDTSTTFTDETGKTWTARGNAQLDTGDYAFATASLLLDGVGDSIDTPNSADFDFGTGDWTVECWVKRNGSVAYSGLLSTLDQNYAGFGLDLSSNGITPRITSSYKSFASVDITSNTNLSNLTWTHLAVVRNGNTLTMYLGGNSVGTADYTGCTCNSSGKGFAVGRNFIDDTVNYAFRGWIDEVRISKGIARYTANFTPPSSEHSISNQIKKFMGVSNI